MCVVSMVTDHYGERWDRTIPTDWWKIYEVPNAPTPTVSPGPSQSEFDALKAEVENLRELLRKAKEYDERTGQPDCEKDEKVELVRRVAELVGIDLSDVLGQAT